MDSNSMVIIALVVVVIGIAIGAWVVAKTPDSQNLEIAKVRFGAAIFTGSLLLIVFAIVVYAAYPNEVGKGIFTAILPALTAISGSILGYLFATKK